MEGADASTEDMVSLTFAQVITIVEALTISTALCRILAPERVRWPLVQLIMLARSSSEISLVYKHRKA